MKSMTKKLLVLITGLLLIALSLSSCGLDSVETNEVSDEARQNFIDSMLYAEGAEVLYAPLIMDEEGNPLYSNAPSGYRKVSKSEGGQTGTTNMYELTKNEKFGLYMDFETTDIAVVDFTTGFAYHSNPKRDPDTTLTNPQQATVGSPLSVEAFDASGKRYSFNFYSNCWEDGKGAFYVMKTSDGNFRVIYTIGNDPDKDLFPPVITKDTYENTILTGLQAKLDDHTIDEKKFKEFNDLLKRCYRYITPNPTNKSEELKVEDKERFRETFPTIDVMSLYISYDKVSTKQKSQVKELMETIGFTVKDVKKEMEKADYQGPERAVLYTIPVDLILNENGLSVNIDSSLILGPTKQRLNTIGVYRGFGANNRANYKDGYMIVPDGSGAVIPINGNLTKDVFKNRIYGADGSFSREYSTDYSEQILAPFMVFDRGGFSEEDTRYNGGGVIAILEEGAAQANMIARPISGSGNPVSSINYEIIYSETDYRTYSTSAAAVGGLMEQTGSGLLLSKEEVSGNYRIQYLFTQGAMTYSDYAKVLRDYFTQTNQFPSEKLNETELPLFVDLIGCVDMNKTVLGIPVKTETPLTTYKQAQEILTKLKESGVNNVVARYTYWSNGGENNTAANDIDLLNCMGSKAELSALIQYCNDNGMGFFPSADFLHVTTIGNGFSQSQDAARRMNRSTATIIARMNANGSLRKDLEEKILVSSKVSVEMAQSYKASFEETVNLKSIALGEIGKELHSNYKTNDGVTRLWAEKDHMEVLKTFEGYDIAVSTGNFYTWKYASHIFGLPTGSTEYLMETGSIPFMQMLLHGYVNYSMDFLNASGDYETALLLALETGSSFAFRWMGAEDSVFDYTVFYNYFSLNYEATMNKAVEIYKEAASVLNDVLNEPITEHVALDTFYVSEHEGLIGWVEVPVPENSPEGTLPTYEPAVKRIECGGAFATVYGDKKVVIVNYNDEDVELNDRTVIEAKSYKVLTLEEYNKIIEGTAYEPEPVVEVPGENDDQSQEG